VAVVLVLGRGLVSLLLENSVSSAGSTAVSSPSLVFPKDQAMAFVVCFATDYLTFNVLDPIE
jgi:hypothetical protein